MEWFLFVLFGFEMVSHCGIALPGLRDLPSSSESFLI